MAKDIQVHIDTIRAELAQLGHEAIATELHDAVRYSATGTEIHMRLRSALQDALAATGLSKDSRLLCQDVIKEMNQRLA